MVDNLDLASCNEAPQIHETVDRGIHREKIRVNDGHRNFADVCAGPSSKKSRLSISEIALWEKPRLSFKNRFNPHCPQIRLAN